MTTPVSTYAELVDARRVLDGQLGEVLAEFMRAEGDEAAALERQVEHLSGLIEDMERRMQTAPLHRR